MIKIRDVKRLGSLIVRLIADSLRPLQVSLFIFNKEDESYNLLVTRGKFKMPDSYRFAKDSPLISYITTKRNAFTLTEIVNALELSRETKSSYMKNLKRQMSDLKIELCVPGFIGGRLLVFLVLGEKLSGDRYTKEDIDIFISLADQTALALENVLAYEELKETEDKLIKAQRLAGIGTLSKGLAHEIKNPLTVIRSFTEVLQERYNEPGFREKFFRIVNSEIDRINYVIEQLLDFAQPVSPNFQDIQVHNLLDEAVSLVEHDFNKKRISIIKDYHHYKIEVSADSNQLKEVFLNLFLNALDAMKEGDKLTIITQIAYKELRILISDTGCGIPEENIPQLFDPFFSTKDKGHGLGLSIAYNIVKSHKGTIDVKSKLNAGTTFIITLPIKKFRV
jgi:signal transduction histidine kinase